MYYNINILYIIIKLICWKNEMFKCINFFTKFYYIFYSFYLNIPSPKKK